MRYRCPTDERWPGDIVGCGHKFHAEPDREGLIDCPKCGLWFPEDENVIEESRVRAAVRRLGQHE